MCFRFVYMFTYKHLKHILQRMLLTLNGISQLAVFLHATFTAVLPRAEPHRCSYYRAEPSNLSNPSISLWTDKNNKQSESKPWGQSMDWLWLHRVRLHRIVYGYSRSEKHRVKIQSVVNSDVFKSLVSALGISEWPNRSTRCDIKWSLHPLC